MGEEVFAEVELRVTLKLGPGEKAEDILEQAIRKTGKVVDLHVEEPMTWPVELPADTINIEEEAKDVF